MNTSIAYTGHSCIAMIVYKKYNYCFLPHLVQTSCLNHVVRVLPKNIMYRHETIVLKEGFQSPQNMTNTD